MAFSTMVFIVPTGCYYGLTGSGAKTL